MNPLPVQPFNKFPLFKKNYMEEKGQEPENKRSPSGKQLERLHAPRITALLSGPIPRRLVLNRWHDHGLRVCVYHLNRAIPEAEHLARTGDREHVRKLLWLYVTAQVDLGRAVDGMLRHTQDRPKATEEARLWQVAVEVSERVRRLRKVLKLLRYQQGDAA